MAQVRAAQAGRAPIERRISRFAAVYTPIVVGLSLLVMLVPPLFAWRSSGHGWDWGLWREWFGRGLVVLVIACPCALVIATPVAVVSGLAAAARAGILIRGGEYLEEIGRLRALAFDKTGTLTQGQPDVVEVVCAPGQEDEERVVRIAAALGDRGGHVLGKAIARYARGRSLDVPVADDYTRDPRARRAGAGRRGRVSPGQPSLHRRGRGSAAPSSTTSSAGRRTAVGTAVALTAPSGPLGWIRLADRPRPEAAPVLAELHQLGLRTIMLTGDNAGTAAAMARELGVGEQRAGPAARRQGLGDRRARRPPRADRHGRRRRQRRPRPGRRQGQHRPGRHLQRRRAGDRRHRPPGRRPRPAPLADPPQPRHPGLHPPEHRPGPGDQGPGPDPRAAAPRHDDGRRGDVKRRGCAARHRARPNAKSSRSRVKARNRSRPCAGFLGRELGPNYVPTGCESKQVQGLFLKAHPTKAYLVSWIARILSLKNS